MNIFYLLLLLFHIKLYEVSIMYVTYVGIIMTIILKLMYLHFDSQIYI